MPPYMGPRWGVKYRNCSQNLTDVTGIICEKTLSHYLLTCKKDHFQCSEFMCILSIYVCDQVSDCFDGSDEIRCSYGKTWHFSSPNSIVMPYIYIYC